MNKEELSKLIKTAHGDIKADLVIKHVNLVNVFTAEIQEDVDIAISGKWIAGVGSYEGEKEINGKGMYAAPGFIDCHIHIESSYLSPEELGRIIVPHGGTTIVADPHEIVNVCGIPGLDYMMKAAKNTKLDIKFQIPSCVPATPFEDAGAIVKAEDMEEPLRRENVLGLAEFMNYPGVIGCADLDLDKIIAAKNLEGKVIDGHAPGVHGKDLTAYISAGIRNDHECESLLGMEERLRQGVYVMLRQGTVCHDLNNLVKGVSKGNSRRILLCSDDRQPKTILTLGHLDNSLRMCVEAGIDPIEAIRFATLNAAECFHMYDKGAIAPGYLADIVLLDDLKDFKVRKVFAKGELVAEEGKYLPSFSKEPIDSVSGSIHIGDFSKEKFKMRLKSDEVWAIEILPGGVLTKKVPVKVNLDKDGEFVFDEKQDIVKVAVVERHKGTGKVGCGFMKGYGLKRGAIALSVAHDSHNMIVVGTNDDDMALAITSLAEQKGGIVLIEGGKVIENMPMPIAGIMSDQSGEWVMERLNAITEASRKHLEISEDVNPVMTLSFMSLCVIPEIKLTDRGLFDVPSFQFIPVEVNGIH
ncbi:MAG: adenine deaminase [Bacilli bacterium]|nr:adenine deaminase [Bacilli bacterium]